MVALVCTDGDGIYQTGGFIEGDTVFLYEVDKDISPENAVDGQIAEILVPEKAGLDVHLKKGVTYAFGFTRSGVSNKAYLYKDPQFLTSSGGYVSYAPSFGEISVNPRAPGGLIISSVYLSIRNES